ncbi:MAG: riboflavin kinase [Bacteroidota bacterium]
MKLFHDFDQLNLIKNPVVTTGSFDGVHVGHKVIINHLNKTAKEIGGESTLITFHPHPRKVLYPETAGKELFLINSQREKIELLHKAGLHNLIIIKFSIEFSQLSSINFVRKILVEQLHAKRIIVGFNHFFGHNREGNYEFLSEMADYYGFGVEEIPEQDIQNESVSSTKIRKALFEGNIQRANAYLDHQYIIMGRLSASTAPFAHQSLNALSISIDEEHKLIPPIGAYAVQVMYRDEPLKGMALIYKHPNIINGFDKNIAVDVTLTDASIEKLLGKEVTVYFHKRISDTNYLEIQEVGKVLNDEKLLVEELIY